jgi:hypothetical protein
LNFNGFEVRARAAAFPREHLREVCALCGEKKSVLRELGAFVVNFKQELPEIRGLTQ